MDGKEEDAAGAAVRASRSEPSNSDPRQTFSTAPPDGRGPPRTIKRIRLGADVLRRIADPPASGLDQLLPWPWKMRPDKLAA
jgi:hypothetical protein